MKLLFYYKSVINGCFIWLNTSSFIRFKINSLWKYCSPFGPVLHNAGPNVQFGVCSISCLGHTCQWHHPVISCKFLYTFPNAEGGVGGWWWGARPHLKILEIVTEINSGLVDRKISSVDLELELETEREGGLNYGEGILLSILAQMNRQERNCWVQERNKIRELVQFWWRGSGIGRGGWALRFKKKKK